MNDTSEPTGIQRYNTSRLLVSVAKYASESADKFCNWLVISFGLSLSLIVSNIDKLSRYLDIGTIKIAALLYVFTFFLVLIQKRISFIVIASCTGFNLRHELEKQEGASALSPEYNQAQFLAATIWPTRWWLKRQFKTVVEKAQAGDVAWNIRRTARRAQWQQMIVVIQAAITIYAAYLIADSIVP